MRFTLLLPISVLAYAQSPPAPGLLEKAYQSLEARQYDEAAAFFLKGIEAQPLKVGIRKDLAYTYLKIGETEAARDQFAAAMRLDPADFHAALEYAFLCHETKLQAEARRVFDRVRKTGDPESRATAEKAFQNIDQPLAAGIERWKKALELSPDTFTAHHELAGLAEQRDDLELAAKHYRRAWEILGSRKQTLIELGRVLRALNRVEESNAALLAASRAGEPRARQAALELLPERYPYVYEFRQALELDPNIEMRRELAFLLMAMQSQPEAEREFQAILERSPDDLLSSVQLGFLYQVRDEKARAKPLLERALQTSDIVLANRVRAALNMPLIESAAGPVSNDARIMAERSLESGYLKEALRYLQAAHANDRNDGWVMLKLGWTYNILRADSQAFHWFRRARGSSDPKISAEARQAYNNLRPELAPVRTTIWVSPFFSTRWHDAFGYGQVKTDLKLGQLPFRPYVSMRLFGDSKGIASGPLPQYLSESSVVVAAGIASAYWRGLMAWGEAGSAISYRDLRPQLGRSTPDYRGGVSFGKGFGHPIGSGAGWFSETNADGIFVSRFDNDFLLSFQTRVGLTPPPLGSFQTQFFWNNNIVRDAKRVDWANYVEFGPGVRFRWRWMPRALLFSIGGLRGYYLVPQYFRQPNYYDVRVGFWYANTR